MNDLIERQAAIDIVYRQRFGLHKLSFDIIMEKLSELPSAQPEQRWIPVEEKLPEQAGWYLISFGDKWAGDGLGAVSGKRKAYDSDVRISSWDGTKFYHGMVAAWMPLPKPWKGEEGCMT